MECEFVLDLRLSLHLHFPPLCPPRYLRLKKKKILFPSRIFLAENDMKISKLGKGSMGRVGQFLFYPHPWPLFQADAWPEPYQTASSPTVSGWGREGAGRGSREGGGPSSGLIWCVDPPSQTLPHIPPAKLPRNQRSRHYVSLKSEVKICEIHGFQLLPKSISHHLAPKPLFCLNPLAA